MKLKVSRDNEFSYQNKRTKIDFHQKLLVEW